MANDYVDQVQVDGVDYDIREAFDSAASIRIDGDQELTEAERAQALRNLGLATRYGYRRAKANSDPDTRITYLFDAEGMTPAKMTFDSNGLGTWSYGDWQDFIEGIARPVMLKSDGTVDYELDHDDQTKKLDGTASDIADTTYGGNAMVEFGSKYKWVKRYEDDDYQYVIFCNIRYDSTYHAYAHTGDDGAVKDAFYLGMFTGPYDSNSKLRSLATGSCATSQTAEVEITRAKSVGDDFYIMYKSAWEYVADLLTLIGKNDNSQEVFGYGIDGRKNAIQAPGSLVASGPFYGTNDGLYCVKTIWIENLWGNMWQRLAGYINNSGTILTRMYGPYCDTPVSDADYSTYTSAGSAPSSNGYAKGATLTDETGIVFTDLSGSSTTYLCDYGYVNNSQVDFALVGASCGASAGCAGSRCLRAPNAASDARGDIGSRLSKKPS